MQNIEFYDKLNNHQDNQILSVLKKWYQDNDVQLSTAQVESLCSTCIKVFSNYQQDIRLLTNKLQQSIKNRHQISERLIQYEKENSEFKNVIQKNEEEKRQFSLKLQESIRELQREKQQNQVELKVKQVKQKMCQELSTSINRKQQQIFTLNITLQNLKCEIEQISQRNNQLMLTCRQLKKKCQVHQLNQQWMKTQNQKLKNQVDKLKNTVQEKKELLNKYMTAQQIQQQQSVALKKSIYCLDDRQYQEQDFKYQNDENDRQCFQNLQNNCQFKDLKMSGYYGYNGFNQRIQRIDSDNSSSKKSSISRNSKTSNSQRYQSKNKNLFNSQQNLNRMKFAADFNNNSIKLNKKNSVSVSPKKFQQQFNYILKRNDNQISDKDSFKKFKNLYKEISRLKNINKQLKQQVNFLKNHNNKINSPQIICNNNNQDFQDFQSKIQFFNSINHQNLQRFFEMKKQKIMKHKLQFDENARQQMLIKELGQLKQQKIKENIIEKKIVKLNDFNNQLLLDSKITVKKNLKEDQLSIKSNQLLSQQNIDDNLTNFRNQIHVPKDLSLNSNDSQQRQIQLSCKEIRDKKIFNNLQQQIICNSLPDNQKQPQQNYPKFFVDYEAQTQKIQLFSNLQQAKIQKLYKQNFEQNKVQNQTDKDVGIQINFKVQCSNQTDISYFTNNDLQYSSQKDLSTLTVVKDTNDSMKINNQLRDIKSLIILTASSKTQETKKYQTQFKLISQNRDIDQILKSNQQTPSIEKIHFQNHINEIDIDEQILQYNPNDHNQAQTINRKNVFKINLNVQYANKMKIVKIEEELQKLKPTSSRVDSSTTKNSSLTFQSQIITDRKQYFSSNITREQSQSIYEKESIKNSQVWENDAINQILEEDISNQLSTDSQKNKNGYQKQKKYLNHQIQTQSLIFRRSIGIQTQQQCCGIVISKRQYYLLTRQSEEERQDSQNYSHQNEILDNNKNSFSVISQQQSNKKYYEEFNTSKKQNYNKQYQRTNDKSYQKIQTKNITNLLQNQNIQSNSQFRKLIYKQQNLQQKQTSFQNPNTFTKNYIQQQQHIAISIIQSSQQNQNYSVQDREKQFELDQFEVIQSNNQEQFNEEIKYGKQIIQSLFNKNDNEIRFLKKQQPNKETLWKINQIYIMKVELNQNQQIKDEFIFWKEGLFSLQTQDYLKLNNSKKTINDPNMLILGDNELTAWCNHLWVRQKESNSCFQGSLKNNNWKITTRYSYIIQ